MKPEARQGRYTADVSLAPHSALTALPERQALQRHLDAANWGVLRWLVAVAAFGALGGLIEGVASGRPLHVGLWALALLVDLVLIFGRRRDAVKRAAHPLLIVFLATHLAGTVVVALGDPVPAVVFSGFLFPMFLAVFRMRWFEYAGLQTMLLTGGTWAATREALGASTSGRAWLIANMVVCVLIASYVAIRITRRRAATFLAEWRHEVAREQEEARMRGELLDAREIQLSMLPRSTPELDWLDASGLSMPASEVGGDYYEYFSLDAHRLAVVIGDVAGHGVASGLVLSGVRSGLHLLREELSDGAGVLERLHRMVRDTAPRRMFVTIQVAVIDRRRRLVSVTNAGHPRALYLPAEGDRVVPIGAAGLPLGTRLEPDYREVQQQLGRGDVLIFYSDGVPEAQNLAGRAFGDERLLEAARKAVRAGAARQIRDSILSAVSRFKGDAVQADDVTLVVLKLGETGVTTA